MTPLLSARVLARGPSWAVYDKPAGMTVVNGRGVPRPTLLDVAVDEFGAARPVHRLDKPTSGCCIVALTAAAQTSLSDAFRRRTVDKRYIAVVEGVPSWKNLTVDARLARIDDPELDASRRPGKKAPLAIQTVSDDGERALTRLQLLAAGDGVSLVLARPETGRMHQIRVHLSHTGFPIVGDVLYGATSAFVDEQALALHAAGVSFPRPEGGRETVIAPVPKAWWAFAATKHLSMTSVKDAMAELLKTTSTPTPRSPAAARATPSAAPPRSAPSRRGDRRGR